MPGLVLRFSLSRTAWAPRDPAEGQEHRQEGPRTRSSRHAEHGQKRSRGWASLSQLGSLPLPPSLGHTVQQLRGFLRNVRLVHLPVLLGQRFADLSTNVSFCHLIGFFKGFHSNVHTPVPDSDSKTNVLDF